MTDKMANGKADGQETERFLELERQVTAHGHAIGTLQPGFPTKSIHRRLALPIPLASFSIGATTWFLGLLILGAHNVTLPNAWIINGLPMGFGLTLLAGIGEIFTGNTFGCALFLSVAAIVLGLALVFLPWTGIAVAFVTAANGSATEGELGIQVASGIYLLVSWAVLFILLISAQRTAISFITALIFINIVVITFGVSEMTGNASCLTTAGAFLIIVSANLFYNGTSLLLLEVDHPLAKFMPLGMLAPH